MTSDKSFNSLRDAEPKIREFLARYSDDSRSGELQKLAGELELHRLERRFELRAKGLAASETLLPVEQTYLEAIRYADLDPQRAAAKLEAMIDLYGRRADHFGPTGQCLELAGRQLQRLRGQVDRAAADHLALLQERLDQADELRRTDPARAREIWKAVIELYRDKPWAAEPVRRAEKALAGGREKREERGRRREE